MRNQKILIVIVAIAVLWIFGDLQGVGKKQESPQQWTVESHDSTNFPLVGKHRTTSCRDCHLGLVFEGTPRECESCHWERRQDDRYLLRLGIYCGECHTPYTWKNVSPNKWNHTASTGYPLKGQHRTLDCVDCHGDEGFDRRKISCLDCHEEDYEEAVNPDHQAAGFPSQCQLCHLDQNNWEGATFSHDLFVLKGKHKVADCSDCHDSGQYAGLSSACVSCHLDDYNGTDDPDHKATGFPTECVSCHGSSANTWEGARFAHTSFPLRGQHRVAQCSDCHPDGKYAGTSTNCVSCHLDDYNGTDDPDHRALGFSTNCVACHGSSASTWEDSDYTHTAFLLKGQHKVAQCSDCHQDGRYAGTSTNCVSCHLNDYNGTDDPDHQALGFPTDCISCHGSGASSWETAGYAHTAFPLSGQHKVAQCSDCHPGGKYAGTSSACVTCHLDDYNGTDDPDHQALGFPTDCVACHGSSASSWEGADYAHTAFPLSGQHKVAQCSDCHPGGKYAGTSSACVTCHLDDYNGTDDPDHQAMGFPTDCVACHGSGAVAWDGASYDHSSYPLIGQHKVAQCSDCHPNGRYAGTSTACVSCHQDDYNGTTDPDHQALNFSTLCETCHGTGFQSWQNVIFDHSTYWPLQGAHTNLSCASCHDQGYSLPQNCYGCHAQDYNNATDPDHIKAGFPTNCEFCHYPTHYLWSQAVFDHSFPIDTGKHSSASCSDCHVSSNFKEFSCLTCHTHDKTRMDSEHGSVTGYTYESTACYACHPQGRG